PCHQNLISSEGNSPLIHSMTNAKKRLSPSNIAFPGVKIGGLLEICWSMESPNRQAIVLCLISCFTSTFHGESSHNLIALLDSSISFVQEFHTARSSSVVPISPSLRSKHNRWSCPLLTALS
ncbi:hypothetical protein TorRG33x02_210260, partial [Trema orientale]